MIRDVSNLEPDLELTVLNCSQSVRNELTDLLSPYGITIKHVDLGATIPGSFFGEREAGLIGNVLYIRDDTPVHSALHEACHYICMTPDRRAALDTDAEGDFDEENGVCYLQILFADRIASMGKDRMLQDMDSWGYSFRLGSARAWFERDAEDALSWLKHYQIVDLMGNITLSLRNNA